MSLQKCTCPIRPNMTKRELIDEIYAPGLNCCHPHYSCPTLDKELRAAEKREFSRDQQRKQLIKKGFTPAEAEQKVGKGRRIRRTRYARFAKVELED